MHYIEFQQDLDVLYWKRVSSLPKLPKTIIWKHFVTQILTKPPKPSKNHLHNILRQLPEPKKTQNIYLSYAVILLRPNKMWSIVESSIQVHSTCVYMILENKFNHFVTKFMNKGI